jgi:uncharacterized membrane protein YhhN
MTTTTWLCVVIAGGFAVVDWQAVRTGDKPMEFVCKPATMIALVGAAASLHPHIGDVRAWFVLALSLSLAGDVFLMLPADAHGSGFFLPGLASFLLAHLAYIGGLRIDVHSQPTVTVTLVMMTGVGIVLGTRILRALRGGGNEKLTVPVVAYMAVITVMAATALATRDAVVASAALLFYVSDAFIAEDRFVHHRSWQPLTIIVTYHVAQFLFVISLLR